jgi:predicted metal-dependent phosphoesterase TrpH
MGFADLHIHTAYSVDGTATPQAVLKHAAHHTNLDVIAITDHDEIRGALEARELAGQYAIEVVPGIEVSSRDGHILALWVERNIPAGLSAEETIGRIGEQDGLAIGAHPMSRGASSLSDKTIRRVLDTPDLAAIFLGIETFNAGLLYDRMSNRRARLLAQTLPVTQVANSDAHTPWMIGAGRTEFAGHRAADLRRALLERTVKPVVARDLPGPLLAMEWFTFYALRLAGFVLHNPAPERGTVLMRSGLPFPNLREFFEPSYVAANKKMRMLSQARPRNL